MAEKGSLALCKTNLLITQNHFNIATAFIDKLGLKTIISSGIVAVKERKAQIVSRDDDAIAFLIQINIDACVCVRRPFYALVKLMFKRRQ